MSMKVFNADDRITIKDRGIVYTGIAKKEMSVNEEILVVYKDTATICKIIGIGTKTKINEQIELLVEELEKVGITIFEGDRVIIHK